jgi:hypothetical protein
VAVMGREICVRPWARSWVAGMTVARDDGQVWY